MSVEICLPVYNEESIVEKNIIKVIDFCRAKDFTFPWKIVAIVNGSTDQTLKICQELERKYPDVLKTESIEESGKGRAIKTYFLKSQADVLAYMDIDLAVSLENLSALLEPLVSGEFDLVLGSRMLSDSRTERSFLRELNSQSCNLLSRAILDHDFTDTQCGFKAIKRSSFNEIADNIKDNRWFFDTELVVFAKNTGFKIKEIPVDWSESRYDNRKSKVRIFRDGLRFLKNFFLLRRRIKNV